MASRRKRGKRQAGLFGKGRTGGIDQRAILWKAVSIGCGALSGLAVERTLAFVWRAAVSDDPPANPADRNRSFVEAIIWGAAVGIGAGIARVVANRGAATVWEAAAGEAPPGVPS